MSIFSAAEMKKAKSKQEPMNESIDLLIEVPWDTLKAQVLAKIVKTLKPELIKFEDYIMMYYISHTLPKSGLSLAVQEDFDGLMKHVKGMPPPKVPIVNIVVVQVAQPPVATQGQKLDPQSDDEAAVPAIKSPKCV